jgi:transposase
VAERDTLERGLRSAEAFTVRRCQAVLASAEGQHTTTIARTLRCHEPTVRNTMHAFNQRGGAVLRRQSSRPPQCRAVFDAEGRERLRALPHQHPRTLGQPTSRWTLRLAAEVSYAQGLTPRQVSGEAIRLALTRLGVRWQRAKHGIISPDPASLREKTSATASSGWSLIIRHGRSVLPMQSGGAAWPTRPSIGGARAEPSPASRS